MKMIGFACAVIAAILGVSTVLFGRSERFLAFGLREILALIIHAVVIIIVIGPLIALVIFVREGDVSNTAYWSLMAINASLAGFAVPRISRALNKVGDARICAICSVIFGAISAAIGFWG